MRRVSQKKPYFSGFTVFAGLESGFGPRFALPLCDEITSRVAAEARAGVIESNASKGPYGRGADLRAVSDRRRLTAGADRGVFEAVLITSRSSPFLRGVPMRTPFSLRLSTFAAAVGLVLVSALPACAESILNLGTGITKVMQPASSDSFSFTLSNVGTTTAPDNFVGWVLGVQLVPRVGTTGTLTPGSLTGGATNPMPPGAIEITQPALSTLGSSATINGLTQYYFMGISATEQFGTVAVGQTYQMGSLGLTASANALGTWDVYTVQQNNPLFKTYFFDGAAAEQQFGNIPWVVGGTPQGNYSLKLGEVQVVPEPSTIALLGLAGLGAGGYAETVRRRKRKAAVAGDAVAA